MAAVVNTEVCKKLLTGCLLPAKERRHRVSKPLGHHLPGQAETTKLGVVRIPRLALDRHFAGRRCDSGRVGQGRIWTEAGRFVSR